jgi:hypothetical protein
MRGILSAVLQKFQRRAEEVSLLIREAILPWHPNAAGGMTGGDADGRADQFANRVALDAAVG